MSVHALDSFPVYLRNSKFLEARQAIESAFNSATEIADLRKILACSIELRDFDLNASIMDSLLHHKELSAEDRFGLSMQYSRECAKIDARHICVRALRELSGIFDREDKYLNLIGIELLEIREFSMALQILEKVSARKTDDKVRKLWVVNALARLDSVSAHQMLMKVLEDAEETVSFWEHVSTCHEILGDFFYAIDATKNALKLGADDVRSRRRLVALFLENNNSDLAISEIRRLLEFSNLSDDDFRRIAGFASRTGDVKLTVECALRQFRGKESQTEAYLHLVHTYNDLDDKSGATVLLEALCDQVSGLSGISAHEWCAFANEAARNGRSDLEIRITEMALEVFPLDDKLLRVKKRLLSHLNILGAGLRSPPKGTQKEETRKKRKWHLW